jgi:flagellar motor protein MotB
MLKSLGSNDPRAAHLDDPRMGGPGQPIGDLGQEPPMMLPQGGSGVLLAQWPARQPLQPGLLMQPGMPPQPLSPQEQQQIQQQIQQHQQLQQQQQQPQQPEMPPQPLSPPEQQQIQQQIQQHQQLQQQQQQQQQQQHFQQQMQQQMPHHQQASPLSQPQNSPHFQLQHQQFQQQSRQQQLPPPMEPHQPLRSGKWTIEEEDYAMRIVNYFNSGRLRITVGVSLVFVLPYPVLLLLILLHTRRRPQLLPFCFVSFAARNDVAIVPRGEAEERSYAHHQKVRRPESGRTHR